MASKRVAVDLGSSTVRALEIAKSGDGVQVVTGGRVPMRTPPGVATDRLRATQVRALSKCMEAAGISNKSVVAGISGQNAFIRNIKLPPIPDSRVDQIVRYEVQQTIPFRLEDIAVDYQLLQEENAPEMEVVLVAMKGDVCEQFIAHLGENKLKPAIVDANPLAIYNAYVYNDYSNEVDCTAILDFGATTTTILIEYDGHLRFTRCVGLGGNDITQLLANELGKSFEEAEIIKMKAGLLFPPPGPNAKVSDDQRKISAVLTRAIDRLLGEVKLSIGYFRTQTGAVAVSRAFICGGGAQMRNLRPLIADRLGVQVEYLNPFRKVQIAEGKAALKRQALEFTSALGYALRGVQPCALEIDLEPPRLVAARRRRVQLACYGASFALLIVASFLGGTLAVPDVKFERAKLAAYEQAMQPYQAVEPERAKLATKAAVLREEYLLRSQDVVESVPLLELMRMLHDTMPPAVFIETLTMSDDPDTAVLTGYADAGSEEDNFKLLFEFSKRLEKYTGKEPELKRTPLGGRDERVKFKLLVKGVPPNTQRLEKLRAAYIEAEKKKAPATEQPQKTAAEEPAAPAAGEPAAEEAA